MFFVSTKKQRDSRIYFRRRTIKIFNFIDFEYLNRFQNLLTISQLLNVHFYMLRKTQKQLSFNRIQNL